MGLIEYSCQYLHIHNGTKFNLFATLLSSEKYNFTELQIERPCLNMKIIFKYKINNNRYIYITCNLIAKD